jgi:hypothetical protein
MNTELSTSSGLNTFLTRTAYRLVSCLLPYLFLSATVSLLSDFLVMVLGRPAPSFWLLLAAGACAGTGVSALLRSEQATRSSRLRTLTAGLLIVYALVVLRHGSPFPQRLIPTTQESLLGICLCLQWIWAGRFETFFSNREQFILHMKDKNDRVLYEAIRNDDILSAATDAGLRSIQSFSRMLSFSLFCILVIGSLITLAGTDSTGVSPLSLLFCVLFFCLHLLSMTVIKTAIDEQFYAGLGLGSVFSLSRQRLLIAAGIIGSALALSAALFSDAPIIPPEFLLWLLGLLRGLHTHAASVPQGNEFHLPEQDDSSFDQLSPFPQISTQPGLDLTIVLRILKYIGLVAAVILALFFMFSPLFGKKWKSFWKENRLRNYLTTFFRMLRDAIKNFFRHDNNIPPVIATVSRKNLSQTLQNQIHSGKSLQKKREIGRLTTGFFRILDWGETAGIICSADQPPFEYVVILSLRYSERSESLQTAARLFEKALYSPQLLDVTEEKLFFDSVDRAILPIQQDPEHG